MRTLLSAVAIASVSAAAPALTTLHAIGYTAVTGSSNGMTVAEIVVDEAKGHASFWMSPTFGVIDGASPSGGGWASAYSKRFNYSFPAAFWVASQDFVLPFNLNGTELELTSLLQPSGWYLNGGVAYGRQLIGVGELGDSNATMIAIDIDTGKVKVSPANAGNYVTFPQNTAGVAPPAYSGSAKKGSYSFSTSVMQNNNAVIATYDIGAERFVEPDISFPGELDALTPYLPLGAKAGTAGMLAISSYNNSNDDYLLAWGEDRSAAPEKLLTISNDWNAVSAGMAFDLTTRKVYALMTGPDSLLTYGIAVFDLSTHKPTAAYYPLKGAEAATYGLSNLVLASQIE